MTAPRLKCPIFTRDDSYDGIARLRVDLQGNAWIDQEDLAALALLLANPPAINHAKRMREAQTEFERHQREENMRREAERIAAGAAKAADVKRLREQFPALADALIGPAEDAAPAWRVFMPEAGQHAYLERMGPAGPVHTAAKERAMRFMSRDAAQHQARELSRYPNQYVVEEP